MEMLLIEKSVLGCMILSNEIAEKVFANYSEEYFHNPNSKELYRKLKELHTNEKGIDMTILTTIMQKNEKMKDFILDCEQCVSHIDMFEFYIGQLKEGRIKRRLKEIGTKMAAGITDNLDIKATLDTISNKINELQPTKVIDEKQKLDDIITEFEELKKRGDEMTSGFPKLDDLIGGFKRKRTYILGGFPGTGKTGLALYLAQRMAFVQNMKVLFFSLEMSKMDIVGRLASLLSGVPSWKIQKYRYLTQEDMNKITNTCGKIYKTNLKIEDENWRFGEIITKIKEVKPDIVFIDHLQYIPAEKGFEKNHEMLNHYVKQLGIVAKKENLVMFIISQNKKPATGNFHETNNIDFKGSSGIREAADLGMAIVRPIPKKGMIIPKPDGYLELHIIKNRNGKIGKVDLIFNHNNLTYAEYCDKGE